MSGNPGEILALAILLLIAVGLASAALYAVCGKPRTAEAKRRKRQITNGFQLSGGILAGFALVGTLAAGLGVAFFGKKTNSAPLSFSSRGLAFFLIAVSLT